MTDRNIDRVEDHLHILDAKLELNEVSEASVADTTTCESVVVNLPYSQLSAAKSAKTSDIEPELSSIEEDHKIEEDPEFGIDIGKYQSYSFGCSPSFREFFLSSYKINPACKDDVKYLRLAAFLLPRGHSLYRINNETLQLLDCKTLKRVVGHTSNSKTFNGGELIAEFEARFWLLDVTPHNRFQNKARTLKNQQYPKKLRDALVEEFLDRGDNVVDLVTGAKVQSIAPYLSQDQCPVQAIEKIRGQLNSLPVKTFQPIVDRIKDAKLFVVDQYRKEREKETGEWSNNVMLHQLAVLSNLQRMPRPHYKRVASSTRLYTEGANFLNLKREVREFVTPTYWKMDLASAQLRIASALWDFKLDPYLVEGSVWKYLLRAMGKHKDNGTMKDKLKTFMYAALFGATQKTLSDLAREISPKLMSDPLVLEILKARKAVEARLKAGDTIKDAWGHTYTALKEGNAICPDRNRVDARIRSIMAAVCQSWELRLLQPVFDYAEEHGLVIAALLHDGLFGSGDWSPHAEGISMLVRDLSLELLKQEIILEFTPPSVIDAAERESIFEIYEDCKLAA